MARSNSGNARVIINLIFLLIRCYWIWQWFPLWVQAPLQIVGLYYVVVWYIYFIPLYYKDIVIVLETNDYDGTELFLGSAIAIGVPILFCFLYVNTLNKVYASLSDIFGAYHSYFEVHTHQD
eukprot:1070191_1